MIFFYSWDNRTIISFFLSFMATLLSLLITYYVLSITYCPLPIAWLPIAWLPFFHQYKSTTKVGMSATAFPCPAALFRRGASGVAANMCDATAA